MADKYAKRYPGYRKCCVIATEEQRTAALRLFPVADVWGIGRRIARTLNYYGVATALDFCRQPRDRVKRLFHITGVRTWAELNGESVITIDALDSTTKQTIMTSRSFPAMISDPDDLRSHIANHAARCAMKLRRQHSACSLVTAFIQSNHFRDDLPQYDQSGSHSFTTPTNTTSEIVAAADSILARIFRKGIYYKRAGVMVAGISDASAIQPDLFDYDPLRSDKLIRLSTALDKINLRHGADTLMLGSQQYRERDDDGRSVRFVNAIRRAMKSPDYTTRLGAFKVGVSSPGRLFIAGPTDELLHRGLLAIHEDAHTIYLGCHPHACQKAGIEEDQRQDDLPRRDAVGDTRHHHHGRREGYDRGPHSYRRGGIACGHHAKHNAENDGEHGYSPSCEASWMLSTAEPMAANTAE